MKDLAPRTSVKGGGKLRFGERREDGDGLSRSRQIRRAPAGWAKQNKESQMACARSDPSMAKKSQKRVAAKARKVEDLPLAEVPSRQGWRGLGQVGGKPGEDP